MMIMTYGIGQTNDYNTQVMIYQIIFKHRRLQSGNGSENKKNSIP